VTDPSRRYRSLHDPDSLRSLVPNLREAIYISNARGDILDANPAFFALLGVRSLDDPQSYGANELVVDPARRPGAHHRQSAMGAGACSAPRAVHVRRVHVGQAPISSPTEASR